jgi:DNA polymerase-4
MKSLITGMVEKLAYQLRTKGFLASTVTVKIRYNNFDTETKQIKLAYTSFDHILTKTALELFEKVYTRRMRLRLIGIRFTGLIRGSYQINLFEDTTEMLSLYQAIDKIKNRFGADAVSRCSGTRLKTKPP